MTLQKINTRNTVLILMIVAAGAFRLLTYKLSLKYPYEMSNFNTVGAMALFGGAYFSDKWKAYLVPFLALFLSDIALNYFYGVHWNSSSVLVYVCFAIMVFIGSLIKKASIVSVLLASIVSVSIHWLITDLPFGNLYPHTLTGYMQSLAAAIPFERNMLLGDVVFCAILFGGFELAKSKYSALRSSREFAV
jgi:hypothetical protein